MASSINLKTNTTHQYFVLFPLPLHSHYIFTFISCSAGAVSSFIGTTRDTFYGKRVIRLEYEAYTPLALKEMQWIRQAISTRWSGIIRTLIWHRVGVVPVGEASVVIGVSSIHRAEGLAAVAWAIDELKRRVPIWKKEIYEDGSSWKANCEFCPQYLTSHTDRSNEGETGQTTPSRGAGGEGGKNEVREEERQCSQGRHGPDCNFITATTTVTATTTTTTYSGTAEDRTKDGQHLGGGHESLRLTPPLSARQSRPNQNGDDGGSGKIHSQSFAVDTGSPAMSPS